MVNLEKLIRVIYLNDKNLNRVKIMASSILIEKKVKKILNEWKASRKQIDTILKSDEFAIDRFLLIIEIEQNLHHTFNNPANIVGFMNMVNNNPFFEGRKPLDVIENGDIDVLKAVANRIKLLS